MFPKGRSKAIDPKSWVGGFQSGYNIGPVPRGLFGTAGWSSGFSARGASMAADSVGSMGKFLFSKFGGTGPRPIVPMLAIGAAATVLGTGLPALSHLLSNNHSNGNGLLEQMFSPRGSRSGFIRSQMSAISDWSIYEQSGQAGMGSTMSFSQGQGASPIPSLPVFQRKVGYSPAALGATGDLVLALNNRRRG